MFPSDLIDIISKASPLGSITNIVGNLISTVLGGVDMSDSKSVSRALENPDNVQKLKELELQLTDLQNARLNAQKDNGLSKLVRPLLALAAMVTIFVDIYFIDYVHNEVVKQVLVMMLVILVWDIRQIYKFYFGSSEDLPNIPGLNKKK